MPAKQVPPQVPSIDTIQTTFKQLSAAAAELNAASDELSKPMSVCEAALKKLNLGISAWVELSGADSGGYWWDRGLGYAQLKDRWGIALRMREGHVSDEVQDTVEMWPFNDAPRWMRIEAVAKLPDLLEALLKQAEDTTRHIKKKIAMVNELIAAITTIAEDAESADRK
jgi:methyl-accepting chemotaxis protein